MGKKIFDFVIGNPPYQKESSQSISKTNGQKPMTNIFQYFQEAADKITKDASVLIFPGGAVDSPIRKGNARLWERANK